MPRETNEHDVVGSWVRNGAGNSVFIPQTCFECANYDPGEFGDYGGQRISGPWCEKNVWFPVRKGTCKKHS